MGMIFELRLANIGFPSNLLGAGIDYSYGVEIFKTTALGISRSTVPVRTGNLLKSISNKSQMTGNVRGIGRTRAAIIETIQTTGAAIRSLVCLQTFDSNAKLEAEASADYAQYVEFGTERQSEQPYFLPGIAAGLDNAAEDFADAVNRVGQQLVKIAYDETMRQYNLAIENLIAAQICLASGDSAGFEYHMELYRFHMANVEVGFELMGMLEETTEAMIEEGLEAISELSDEEALTNYIEISDSSDLGDYSNDFNY